MIGPISGIKQYGYKYLNKDNNQVVEKSTWAGVPKNSLSFEDIIKFFKGETLTRFIPVRFFKNFDTLDIVIKSLTITTKKSGYKKLVNNVYIPFTIFNLNDALDNRPVISKYINKIIKFIKFVIENIYLRFH